MKPLRPFLSQVRVLSCNPCLESSWYPQRSHVHTCAVHSIVHESDVGVPTEMAGVFGRGSAATHSLSISGAAMNHTSAGRHPAGQ